MRRSWPIMVRARVASAAPRVFCLTLTPKRPHTWGLIGAIVGTGITVIGCHPQSRTSGSNTAPTSHAAQTPSAASTSNALLTHTNSSTSVTERGTPSAPSAVPAVDSACLSEFERALPELPACKHYFQRWMAAFSEASETKAWKRWGEFVLSGTGLLIDNTYEASHSDPNSTASSLSATIPHAAFLDGTALQRFEQLDLRGGLHCIEDDEVWCPDLFCAPYGATQIACSNQGGRDPFQYRWTLRQGNWYLTEIYQTWPN